MKNVTTGEKEPILERVGEFI